MPNFRSKVIVAFLPLACWNLSCALYNPSNGQTYTTTCSIPSDQGGTISGHWTVVPVPLAFHEGDFTPTEVSAMTAAADSWNQFFTVSKTKNTLTYGGSTPTVSAAADSSQSSFCASTIFSNNQFTGNVVIYKMQQWPSAYNQAVIALTSFCTIPNAQPYPTFYQALMEINYQGFFIHGGRVPDLQSIVLHELGHVFGLNHSCESFQKTGTPNCTDPSVNPQYLFGQSIMYPVFGFDATGAGQQNRILGTNDESRVNCLY